MPALFINGMYESTLREIIDAQKSNPTKYGYLQPYSTKRIKLLSEEAPSPEDPTTLYLSVTTSLDKVS